VFCYIFIVETKGLSLEQTATLFDGDEVINQIHVHIGPVTDKKDSKETIEIFI
jgi:hypothetical protein